jgi:hypothetical protein
VQGVHEEAQAPGVDDEFRMATQREGLPQALSVLRSRVERQSISSRAAALLAVEHALHAKSAEVDAVRGEMLKVAPIAELLGAALRRFSNTGTEDVLTMAASLAATDREASWPVLADLVERRDPACEWFVEEVVAAVHEAPQARASALKGLALHPDVNVRRRLLDAAGDYPVLQEALVPLTRDPNEEIRERALALIDSTQ